MKKSILIIVILGFALLGVSIYSFTLSKNISGLELKISKHEKEKLKQEKMLWNDQRKLTLLKDRIDSTDRRIKEQAKDGQELRAYLEELNQKATNIGVNKAFAKYLTDVGEIIDRRKKELDQTEANINQVDKDTDDLWKAYSDELEKFSKEANR